MTVDGHTATCPECGLDITGMGRCPRCGHVRRGGDPAAERRLGRKTTWRSTTDWKHLDRTPPMREALAIAATDAKAPRLPGRSLKALVGRGLCSADGTLTAAGRVYGISMLPLPEQCRILDLPLRDHPASSTRRSICSNAQAIQPPRHRALQIRAIGTQTRGASRGYEGC
jgi:hypothetical protein